MKKVLIFFTAVILLCAAAGFVIAQNVSPQNAVVAVINTYNSGIPEDMFRRAAESAENISLIYEIASSDEQTAVLNEICASNKVSCIIAAAGRFTDTKALITAAQGCNLPIIIMGKRPADDELQSYDKCRYIGYSPVLAGEMLGNLLAQAYTSGIITDNNENYMIDTAVYSNQTADSKVITNALMRQFEYSGCIPDIIELHGAVTESDGYSACMQSLFPERISFPEAYFCTNAFAADGVIAAFCADGVPYSKVAISESDVVFSAEADFSADSIAHDDAETESTAESEADMGIAEFYPIICFGYTENTYSHILSGNLLGAVVPDIPTAVNSAVLMAKNLSFYSSPMAGIEGLTIENDKTVLIPCITVTKSNAQENTWLDSAQNE